jgi:hypothetical protein
VIRSASRHPDDQVRASSASRPPLRERLLGFISGRGRPDAPGRYADEAPPLRSALFSADQMEQHGKDLATVHRVAPSRTDRLLSRLADNERVLAEVGELLTVAVTTGRRITPAAEWLLDNVYVVDEQIRTAKRHLPKGYSRELPRLAQGPSAGLPRVYDLAFEAISHGDGRIDAETLSRFVAAYQTVTPLELGELWAFPIMLRLALIENLRRVGTRVAAGAIDRQRADRWAEQMLEVAERDPKSLIVVTADMARSNPPMTSSFVAELARRLQGQSAALALPLTWIEQRLAESGHTIEQLVHSQTQEQAGAQVSISNTIGSLRFLGATDWRDFVESLSLVESTLRGDPGGLYARMDFATRDRYRHVVESIARCGDWSERDVAHHAVRMAREAAASLDAKDGDDERTAHVGFYLVDEGRPQLERAAGARVSPAQALRRNARRHALSLYLAGIALVTAIATVGLLRAGGGVDVPLALMATLAILLAIASSQLAVGMVNWLATMFVSPRPLPRMDYSRGIPSTSRTLVVVPTLIARADDVESLVEALEVRYLANRHAYLHFGLLTDFADAPAETMPEDEALLRLAQERIDALNEKYPTAQRPRENAVTGDTFFLFHRPRRWNAQERTWMGHERKRGKLADLNALLRGRGEGRFSLVVGATGVLTRVKYVITLDTDTQLPRDSARQFAGAIAHPLNRARFDATAPADRGTVSRGYGILQPRVSIGLPGASRSWYSRLHSGEAGIDPYTRAVSDVYQDAFGEGSFIGKGIYDVDAFERSCNACFPDNRILSHDLLEGCYARSGLLSDVELVEDSPSTYRADMDRRHRWIRGDWQLAGWLLPRVPGPNGRRLRNPLSALSLWKLFDNLRRSLVPAALVMVLALGWTVLPQPWLWTLSVIAILVLPAASALVADVLRKPADVPFRQHLAAAAQSAHRHAVQALLTLALLPDEATSNLDAIVRTSWRMLVSHRRLLEWNPSAHGEPEPMAADRRVRSAFTKAVGSTGIGPVLRRGDRRRDGARRVDRLGRRRADPRPVARLARHRVVDQPADRAARSAVDARSGALPADARAPDLGVLRVLRRSERPRPSAGQLAGASDRDRRASNVADEHGARAAGEPHRLRLRLPPVRRARRAHGRSAAIDGGDGALRRAFLQLVRHADAEAAVAPLRVRRGQRKPRRTPDDAAAGARRARGRSHPESSQFRGTRRCAPVRHRRLARRLATRRAARASHARGRVRCASRDDSRGQDVARASGDGHSRGRGACRRATRHRGGGRGTRGGRRGVLGRDARPPMSRARGRARVPRAVEHRADGHARGAFHHRGARHADLARARRARWRGTRHRRARRMEPPRGRGGPARRGTAGRDRATVAAMRGAGPHGLRLPLRQRAPPARHRLQRRRAPARFELLRPACIGSEVRELRRHRAGTPPAGELVRARAPAHGHVRRFRAAVVERVDVRGPDADARDADLREHAPRPDVPGDGGEPDRLRQVARRALGHLRKRLQRRRRGTQLPVPRVRRPGLGLKRGLAEDLVVAPYASALALMVAPEAACQNLQRLAADGLAGRFGLYEAIDYTVSRVPRGQSSAVVRSFMAHHQGMILLSLAHRLLDRPLQRRFESDPQFKATLLLLQERIPRAATVYSHPSELSAFHGSPRGPMRRCASSRVPDTPVPEIQLLSNGRYHVMVTSAGGGSSRWKDLAVTRWREDSTRDAWGTFCYVRTRTAATSGRPPTTPPSRAGRTTKRSSPRGAPSFAAATTTSRRTPRSWSRPRTTSSSAACASPTRRARGARRRHELCGSGARAARRRCVAPGVLEPVHADRVRGRATGDPLHTSPALARRGGALDVPHDDGARACLARRLVRDRPHGIHRSRTHRGCAAGR